MSKHSLRENLSKKALAWSAEKTVAVALRVDALKSEHCGGTRVVMFGKYRDRTRVCQISQSS